MGLANHTLQAPWIPNASEVYVSRSCPKEADIDAGSPLNSTEDPIPYFNYLSLRMADAPTTLPKLVTSRAVLPPPQLIGYALDSVPTSASGIQQYVNRDIIHLQSNSTPFSQFWAMNVTRNRRVSELRRSSLSWLNRLDRGNVDSSPIPIFDIQRPGTLNLTTLNASSIASPRIPFTMRQPARGVPLDVPTSVSPESSNTMDFLLREESESLPFILVRREPESVLPPESLPTPPHGTQTGPHETFGNFNSLTSPSRPPLNIVRLVLQEESDSLPFFVPKPPVVLTSSVSGEESRRARSGHWLPSTASSSNVLFDIVGLVEREESSSLPFLFNTTSSHEVSSASVTFYDMEQETQTCDKPTSLPSPEILQPNTTLSHLRESSPDRTLCHLEEAPSSLDHKLPSIHELTPGHLSHLAAPAVSTSPAPLVSIPPYGATLDDVPTSEPSSATSTSTLSHLVSSIKHTALEDTLEPGNTATCSSSRVSLPLEKSHKTYIMSPVPGFLQCLQNYAWSLWSLVTSFVRIPS